jgi:hypothetical protein
MIQVLKRTGIFLQTKSGLLAMILSMQSIEMEIIAIGFILSSSKIRSEL